MSFFQFIKSFPASGAENMQIDLELLAKAENNLLSPTLRFYQWSNSCISLGYSQNPEEFLNIPECLKKNMEIVKRPTGGGICFHNQEEITFSFILPTKDNSCAGFKKRLRFLPEIILKTLKNLGVNASFSNQYPSEKSRRGKNHICFLKPYPNEIIVEGRKLVGFAQKRSKKAVLQQGTILVRNNLEELIPFFKNRNPFYFKSMAIGLEEILKRKITFDEFCGLVKDML